MPVRLIMMMASFFRALATTAFSTRFSPRLRVTAVALCMLLASQAALAETIELREARLEAQDDGYAVVVEYNIELSPRLEEAINKGVALFFNFELELARPRWYWFDEKSVEIAQTYRLSYHALTRQYRLSAGTLYQSFSSLGEALRLLSRPRALPIERSRVKPGETYVASVRMRLDVNQLPKPFQLSALTNREWTLDSDWKKFPFRPEVPATNGQGERK
jgi:hypothetical protein